MLRKILFVSPVLAAAAMGYAWTNDMLPGEGANLTSFFTRGHSNTGFEGFDLTGVLPREGGSQPEDAGEADLAQLTGVPVTELGEVFRFDIEPVWVKSRWTRVSAVLSEQQLQGLRVPLVTGTARGDLAGSLTYYFGHRRQVRRITFSGRTGDPQALVHLVTQRFGFQPVPDLGAGMYLVRWNAQPVSALRVAHAPVIRSADPLSQFEVELEINRPDIGYQLSPRFQQMVSQDRARGWWQGG